MILPEPFASPIRRHPHLAELFFSFRPRPSRCHSSKEPRSHKARSKAHLRPYCPHLLRCSIIPPFIPVMSFFRFPHPGPSNVIHPSDHVLTTQPSKSPSPSCLPLAYISQHITSSRLRPASQLAISHPTGNQGLSPAETSQSNKPSPHSPFDSTQAVDEMPPGSAYPTRAVALRFHTPPRWKRRTGQTYSTTPDIPRHQTPSMLPRKALFSVYHFLGFLGTLNV